MKKSRILAWIMSIAMALSLVSAPPAFAADEMTFSLAQADGDVTVKPGEEFTLDITLKNNQSLSSLGINLYYKTSELECVSVNLVRDKNNQPTVWKTVKDEAEEQGAIANAAASANNENSKYAERKANGYGVATLGYSIASFPWTQDGIIASVKFKAKDTITTNVSSVIELEVEEAKDASQNSYATKAEPVTVLIQPSATEQVTVTYKANGGSGDDVQDTVDKGTPVTLRPSNTFTPPANQEFKAWDVDGEEKQPNDSITVNANTEIKAVWKDVAAETVTVTFDSNDGTSAPQKVTVNKGEKVSKPEQDPVRDGFTFTGWFEDENNSGKATKKVDFPYTADKDITFYAVWEENQPAPTEKVTVTFNSNGGTPDETKQEINKGEKVSKPNDPTWENHTFKGWFEDEDATKKVTFPVTVDENTTFYAGWEATYAVEIDEDIEHGKVTAKPTSAAEGDKITLTITPDKGYELDECTVTDEDDDEIEVEDDFTFEMPASNVTVSATFTLSDITVNYTATPAKGGSVTGPKTLKPGDTVTFEVTENDGYTFQTLTFNGETLSMDGKKATFKVPADATKAEVKATFKANSDGSSGSGGSGGSSDSGGCYIATSVYGSYDTPEVWTLRRFRDDVLGQTWYGRLFIKVYYATSPTLVRWFGNVEWFQNFWRDTLDSLVSDLQAQGFESTPYEDKDW